MSQQQQQVENEVSETEEIASEAESENVEESNPAGGRKPNGVPSGGQEIARSSRKNQGGGNRIVPVHESRIKDRPNKEGASDSSLKIKIELDLEVEVELYARVKGDVTIGLM
ncbi:MAG: hypothetical protein M1837_001410 [Sclerophora amabilis]|nr:MAG: hypothetical protein M1837_001410 [Sclerophora amabilis]